MANSSSYKYWKWGILRINHCRVAHHRQLPTVAKRLAAASVNGSSRLGFGGPVALGIIYVPRDNPIRSRHDPDTCCGSRLWTIGRIHHGIDRVNGRCGAGIPDREVLRPR